MKHPTNDMLLAYVRQQQRSLWQTDIQEHIANCSSCSERCAEFKLTGSMLETWAHTSNEDLLYATVSQRVMRAIREPKITLTERVRRSVSQVHVALPVAAVMIVLFVLFVVLGANIVVNAAKSQLSQPTPLLVSPKPTARNPLPIVPFEPIPTVAVSPTVTEPVVTATPQSGPSIAVNTACTTTMHIVLNELHVCGAHFTAKTTVVIYYHIGTSTKKHSVQVAANGTFTDVVYIGDCEDVPTSIYAQDITMPSEKAQIRRNITFGTCQRSQ